MRTRSTILTVSLALTLVTPAAGVMAQDTDPDGPFASFSGWIEPGPPAEGGWSPTIDSDEPRLGESAFWSATDEALGDVTVRTATWRFEDGSGAWEGSYDKFILDPENAVPDDQSVVTATLVGEGAYDGLIALVEFDSNQGFGWAIRGVIVEADLLPDAPAAARPS